MVAAKNAPKVCAGRRRSNSRNVLPEGREVTTNLDRLGYMGVQPHGGHVVGGEPMGHRDNFRNAVAYSLDPAMRTTTGGLASSRTALLVP
jgi:hypothetical protein